MRSDGRLSRRQLNRPVWVKLSVLFRQTQYPPAQFRWDDRTLDVAGQVGTLHGRYRTSTGEWYGLVTITITYADVQFAGQLQLDNQLVPAEALRRRLNERERRALTTPRGSSSRALKCKARRPCEHRPLPATTVRRNGASAPAGPAATSSSRHV